MTRIGVLLLGDMRGDYGGRRVAGSLLHALLLVEPLSTELHVFTSAALCDWFDGSADQRVVEHRYPHTHGRILRVLFEQVRLPWLLRTMDIDVLLCPNNAVPLMSPIPTIVMLQNVKAFVIPGHDSPIKERYRRWIQTKSANRASVLIAVSQTIADEAERFWPQSQQKIRSAYNGVLASRSSPLPRQTVSDGRSLLFVSALRPYKRLDVAIRVLSELCRRGRDLTLHVAGTGDHESRMRLLAQAVGVSERVVWHGRLDDAALDALYARGSMLLFPSEYESFGLPVAEAMAHGLPIVHSGREALSEVARDAGIAVDNADVTLWADACELLLDDIVVWSAMARAGRTHARNYNWEEMALVVSKASHQVVGDYRGGDKSANKPAR